MTRRNINSRPRLWGALLAAPIVSLAAIAEPEPEPLPPVFAFLAGESAEKTGSDLQLEYAPVLFDGASPPDSSLADVARSFSPADAPWLADPFARSEPIPLVLTIKEPGPHREPGDLPVEPFLPPVLDLHADAVLVARSLPILDPAPSASADPANRELQLRLSDDSSRDARELTPLAESHTVVRWDVADWLHVMGTGMGRRPDESEQRFLAIAAEAGVDLSHNAGLRFGYEFMRTGATNTFGPELGGDTLFARLQLRF